MSQEPTSYPRQLEVIVTCMARLVGAQPEAMRGLGRLHEGVGPAGL